MDKDKHTKKARRFTSEDSCYIHCEVKDGETQLAVGGDQRAIIYGCYRTLKRTNELTNFPFEAMLEILEDFYDMETRKSKEDN